jgi:tetratricopeptide (TPR) repeat protein
LRISQRLSPYRDRIKAHYLKGIVLLELGHYEEAVESLSEAIHLDPALFRAYFARGLCFYRKGEYEKALEDFSAAILLNPAFLRGYAFRALTYRALGQQEKMEQDVSHLKEQGFPWRVFLEREGTLQEGCPGEEIGVFDQLGGDVPVMEYGGAT